MYSKIVTLTLLAGLVSNAAFAQITTSTVRSRLQLSHPDLGHIGGASLHAKVADLYEKIGDNMDSRLTEVTIADAATESVVHNLGVDFENLKVLLFDGQGSSKTLITSQTTPSISDFTIIATVGSESTSIDITNGSGGSEDISVLIVDSGLFLQQAQVFDQIATPSNPSTGLIKFYAKSDGNLYTLNSAGEEIQVGSGAGGSGELNLFPNPNADVNVDDWVATSGMSIARTTTASDLPLADAIGTAFTASGGGVNAEVRACANIGQALRNSDLRLQVAYVNEGALSDFAPRINLYGSANCAGAETQLVFANGSTRDDLTSLSGIYQHDFNADGNLSVQFRFNRQGGSSDINFTRLIVGPKPDTSFIINPLVYSQEMSVGTVGAKSNAYGALTDAEFPTPANVAYYHLDGDANADGQAGGNLAAPTTAPEFNAKGFFGRESVANFRTTADGLESSNSFFQITGDITFGGWFNSVDTASDSFLIGRYVATGNNRSYALSRFTTGGIRLLLSNDGSAFTASSTITVGEGWNHIVGAFDSSAQEYKLYVNGQLVDSGSTGFSSLFVGTANFALGAGNAGGFSSNSFIQDAFVYSGELTDDQINAIYSKRFRPTMLRAGHELTSESFTLASLTDKVSYYNMDEASGNLVDGSGNGHTLTANGTPTYQAIGVGGEASAVEFDGSTDYFSSSDSFFDFSNEFTLSAWVAMDWPSFAGSMTIMGKYSTASNRSYILRKIDNQCGVIVSADGVSGETAQFTACDGFLSGSYHMISATFSGGVVKIYIDGVLQATESLSVTSLHQAAGVDFQLGKHGSDYFQGRIDEPVAANYAMSDYEIQKLYAGSLTHSKQLQETNQEWQFALQSEDLKSFNGSVFDPIIDMQANTVYLSPDYAVGTLVEAQLKDKGYTAIGAASQMFDRVYDAAIPASVAHGLADPYSPKCSIAFEGQATSGDWSWESCAGHCEVDSANLVCNLATDPTPTNRVRIVLGAAEVSVPEHNDGVTGLLPSGDSTIYGNKVFDGSVGIGVNPPERPLDILQGTTVGAGQIRMRNALTAGNFWEMGRDPANGKFILFEGTKDPAFVIDDNTQNVGVNEIAPDDKLHLTFPSTDGIRLENTGTSRTFRTLVTDDDEFIIRDETLAADMLLFKSLDVGLGRNVPVDSYDGSQNIGLQIINTALGTDPFNFGWDTGTGRKITMTTLQGTNMTAFGFSDWSTGGQYVNSITVSDDSGSTWTRAFGVRGFGDVGVNLENTSSNNLCASGTGTGLRIIQACTSSRRYKEEIRNITQSEAELLYDLQGVHYKRKDDHGGNYEFGLIAEDVAEVSEDMIGRDNDGLVSSVRYDQMQGLVVELLKKHKQEIDQLKARIEQLEGEVQ